jgi:nucleotide-binding universal stress UspA family protein
MTIPMTQGAVVVGVDGSACSDTALAWGARYAAQRRRPLLVVGAAGIQPVGSELFRISGGFEAIQEGARKLTADAVRAATALEPTLEVEGVTPRHDPRDALLECSERASMVVVGTRGLGPVRRLLLGSVSGAVAAHASCPVAVVRSHDGPESPAEQGPIVVGTDAEEGSAATLELAFELASTRGQALEVVHSWFVLDGLVRDEGPQQTGLHLEDEKRLLAESLAGYAEKYPDVTVHRQLSDDAPRRSLVELSKTASVVVVGAHGRGGADRLSSVSRDVVERAHSTVVVVRS